MGDETEGKWLKVVFEGGCWLPLFLQPPFLHLKAQKEGVVQDFVLLEEGD